MPDQDTNTGEPTPSSEGTGIVTGIPVNWLSCLVAGRREGAGLGSPLIELSDIVSNPDSLAGASHDLLVSADLAG